MVVLETEMTHIRTHRSSALRREAEAAYIWVAKRTANVGASRKKGRMNEGKEKENKRKEKRKVIFKKQ
jgi:hypothetical protein